MTTATQPQLEPGRVYRTQELKAWSTNASRTVRQLVREGLLVPLEHGLFVHPKRGRFGMVPPTDAELMRAFLGRARFLFTGPDQWNALGLGSTAAYAAPLVYNTRRSGVFEIGGRRFILRRVAFPDNPAPEWFVIDLLKNADRAGVSRSDLVQALTRAVRRGEFDPGRLRESARKYGTREIRSLITSALEEATRELHPRRP